jgi:lipopolysaccharide/colanic/teichoic acid biosynthesis glycosyltransferase
MDPVIINQPRVFPYQIRYQIVKRVMDVTLCLLALPLVLPLVAICALAILLDSPGPVLFVQERIGKGGRRFQVYKFRTLQHGLDDSFHQAFMKAFVRGEIGTDENLENRRAFIKAFVGGSGVPPADPEVPAARQENANPTKGHESSVQIDDGKEDQVIFKPIQASEITRVGRILRETSLDELPQLINVLKGEMSLVGPRPNVPWEVEEYRPWHHERLEVLPGITGLAQVRGRSGISFSRIVKYDIEYVEKQNLVMDLKILWWTVSSVMARDGTQ